MDTYLFIGIITAVITVVGIVATVYWNARLRKDKIVESRQTLQVDVEKTAREKIKEEQTTARELAITSASTALDVKREMEEYVNNKIALLSKDIESINRLLKIQDENLTFLKQFMWGTTTKSDAPFLDPDIPETQEHKDAEGEGIFKDTEEEAKDREDR